MSDEPEIEDFNERAKRYTTFMQTDLGKLHRAHEQALINYWRFDSREGNVNEDMLMEFDRISKEATHAYVTELMKLAGV